MDEAWFYLIRDKEKVRMFPGKEKVGSIKVQHKSHIPKVLFICAVSRPDPSRDFDGNIGIWRVCVMKEAQRTTTRHQKGEEYAVDVIIDSDYYQEWYEYELLPAIKEKIPWLESSGVIVQQDGASPHTGKGTEEKLNRVGKSGGWSIQLVRQPAQSPDLNVNDLRFFASLKSRVWRERFGTMDFLVEGVQMLFGEYEPEILERVWQSLFKRYNQVLAGLGGNDFEVEHTKTRKRQREGILPKSVLVDRDASKKALEWWTVKHCVITPCGHSFCRTCAGDAVSRKHACPVCQAAVVGGEAALVRNFVVDEITHALQKAAEDTEKAYMRLLFANASSDTTPGLSTVPPRRPRSPGPASKSTETLPTTVAKSCTTESTEGELDDVAKTSIGSSSSPHTLSPVEEILVSRMRDVFLGYQSYYARELEVHEAEVAGLEARLQTRTAEVSAVAVQGEPGAACVSPDVEGLKSAIGYSKRRFAESMEALLRDFDSYVAASAPPPSLLPATVTVVVASQGVRFDMQLLPTHFPENIYAKVRAFFAASGDEVRRFGDGIRLCLQPLSTTTKAASNGGTGGAVVHRVDSATSTVFRQSPGGRVGAGWALVVEGPIILASGEIKPCFARSYGLPGRDPQERVDYFTCGQCKLNWVCASCATHCHQACEGVRPFAMNHLPSWGCCYCMKRRAKTRCKLAAQGGGAARQEGT